MYFDRIDFNRKIIALSDACNKERNRGATKKPSKQRATFSPLIQGVLISILRIKNNSTALSITHQAPKNVETSTMNTKKLTIQWTWILIREKPRVYAEDAKPASNHFRKDQSAGTDEVISTP